MVDMALVSGVVGTLKTAFEIGKTVKDINDLSQVHDKVIEMQEIILSAQSAAMTAQAQLYELLQDNAELKQKASAVEEWKRQASRYQLKDYGDGTFAYELRAESADGEPIHRICSTCFENKRRSILHFERETSEKQKIYKCLPCGSYIYLGAKYPLSNSRNHVNPWVV